jgi:hypothetical protein
MVTEEVRQAATAVTQQRDYPNASRIAALLRHQGSMRTCRPAWNEALRELGSRTGRA